MHDPVLVLIEVCHELLDQDRALHAVRRVYLPGLLRARGAPALAAGYEALGRLERYPEWYADHACPWTWWAFRGAEDPAGLGRRWHAALAPPARDRNSCDYRTRRQAEDDAARAFSRLPDPVRAALLTGDIP